MGNKGKYLRQKKIIHDDIEARVTRKVSTGLKGRFLI